MRSCLSRLNRLVDPDQIWILSQDTARWHAVAIQVRRPAAWNAFATRRSRHDRLKGGRRSGALGGGAVIAPDLDRGQTPGSVAVAGHRSLAEGPCATLPCVLRRRDRRPPSGRRASTEEQIIGRRPSARHRASGDEPAAGRFLAHWDEGLIGYARRRRILPGPSPALSSGARTATSCRHSRPMFGRRTSVASSASQAILGEVGPSGRARRATGPG